MDNPDTEITKWMLDPSVHESAKGAMRELLKSDCVDASCDASAIQGMLERRAVLIFKGS